MKKLALTLIVGIGSIALSIGQGEPATLASQVEHESSLEIQQSSDQLELTEEQREQQRIKAKSQRKRTGAVAIEEGAKKNGNHSNSQESETPMSQQALKALIEKELEEEDKKQAKMGSNK